MRAMTIQRVIAAVFLGLGGWALLAPSSVIELAFTPAYRDHSYMMHFVMAAFGAQACLFGALALVVKFGSRGFALLAVLLVPFFVFDWYFHWVVPVLTPVGMLDLVGNAVMFVLCLTGWRIARREEGRA